MSRCQTVVPVTEASQVGEARRRAARLADLAGLNDTDRGRVAIVVTELARDPRDPYEAKRTHPLRERCRYAYRGGLSRAVRAEQPTYSPGCTGG